MLEGRRDMCFACVLCVFSFILSVVSFLIVSCLCVVLLQALSFVSFTKRCSDDEHVLCLFLVVRDDYVEREYASYERCVCFDTCAFVRWRYALISVWLPCMFCVWLLVCFVICWFLP